MEETIKESIDANRIHHQLMPMTIAYEEEGMEQVSNNKAKTKYK